MVGERKQRGTPNVDRVFMLLFDEQRQEPDLLSRPPTTCQLHSCKKASESGVQPEAFRVLS